MQLLSNFLQNLHIFYCILREANTIKVLLFVDGALSQNCFIDRLLFFLVIFQCENYCMKLCFFFLRSLREMLPVSSKYGVCPFLLRIRFCFDSSPRLLHFHLFVGGHVGINGLLALGDDFCNGGELLCLSLVQLTNGLFAGTNGGVQAFFFLG